MTDLEALWLRTLQRVVDLAAHEIKDSLNGVSLNVEVLRSRAEKAGLPATDLAQFASAASGQLEVLCDRTEALLYLARPQRRGTQVDVAQTLTRLATLLVPAARAEGITLTVEAGTPAPTSASPEGVRLALAAGLLALIDQRGGHCRLEVASDTVVRFSHESADTCSLDPATAASIAGENIVIQGGTRGNAAGDLLLVFPGS